ncbi:hypothetical protein [Streptomyces sp. NPDC049970]|uniref:hypothetical protein n=1 Tax=Streptomyces sp. NPDC049970 TaxID=3155033 RepID=UPI00341C179A
MHVEDQDQPAAATDTRVRTRRELGQVALPGIEVLLEQEELETGVKEVGGGANGVSPVWYLATTRRFSPVSFTISRRLITPDSYGPRNRLSSDQRCPSKATLDALHQRP